MIAAFFACLSMQTMLRAAALRLAREVITNA